MDANALCPLLYVCPVPDLKSRTEGRRKLKIGVKEARDMGPVTPFRGRKVKGQGHQAD